ncbi:hypothetical protein I547_5823 [Mycobacterium kansasii 824]|nr:hypothetical protein I547_5823 [Mycobacterium kansasii 824]
MGPVVIPVLQVAAGRGGEFDGWCVVGFFNSGSGSASGFGNVGGVLGGGILVGLRVRECGGVGFGGVEPR